ncbi:MAG TPA: MqnA/MqnD/SBP family protein [Gemmataceae bacterium]|nr:MqnA/MqnD/SBP family protein [Gemmataceae bacterium]
MTKRLITVGHSPDPDDAFMFYALTHDKLDTGGLIFRHELQDIETLNRRALRGELEVTAVSIHAYAYLLDKYALLPSGCSMGDRYGPMVVARRPMTVEELKTARIAVPGELTTAFLALRLLLAPSPPTPRPPLGGEGSASASPSPPTPLPRNGGEESASASLSPPGGRGVGVRGTGFLHSVLPFDQIIAAVAEGRHDAGLIIHEGQLTFQKQGLHLVVDLGVWWHQQTGLPLPLGGNVVRRDLGADTMRQISRLLKESIRYGLDHRDEALDYALRYARDMDRSLADRFVGMYVNEWTLDYGPRGREAVRRLLEEGHRAGIIPSPVSVEFVE